MEKAVRERCSAEIGRSGSFHGCAKMAQLWVRVRAANTEMTLGYCRDHVVRAGYQPHTGALASGPRDRR